MIHLDAKLMTLALIGCVIAFPIQLHKWGQNDIIGYRAVFKVCRRSCLLPMLLPSPSSNFPPPPSCSRISATYSFILSFGFLNLYL